MNEWTNTTLPWYLVHLISNIFIIHPANHCRRSWQKMRRRFSSSRVKSCARSVAPSLYHLSLSSTRYWRWRENNSRCLYDVYTHHLLVHVAQSAANQLRGGPIRRDNITASSVCSVHARGSRFFIAGAGQSHGIEGYITRSLQWRLPPRVEERVRVPKWLMLPRPIRSRLNSADIMVLTTSRCHQHAASTDVRPNELAEKAEACRSLDTFCRSDARVAVAFRRCRFAVHRLPLRSLSPLISHFAWIMLSVLSRDSSPNRTHCTFSILFLFQSEEDGIVSGYFQALHLARMCPVHVHFVACFATNIS